MRPLGVSVPWLYLRKVPENAFFVNFDTPRTKSQKFWPNLILKSWKISLFWYGESEKIGPKTVYQPQRGGEQEGVVVLLTT